MRTATLKSNCKWVLNKTNDEYVSYLSSAMSVSRPFAQVLINRGIKRPAQFNSFINPSLSEIADPFKLTGIQKAVFRLKLARQNREKVLICGDYDADGLTATAVMLLGLRQFGLEVDYFIPNRLKHGYGMPVDAVSIARNSATNLIITVDCGITSFDALQYASKMSIDVIITDHHEPAFKTDQSGQQIPDLPEAYTIINPKVSHDDGFEHLSGAGIAFLLVLALFDTNDDEIVHLLDLTAIGTLADVVPLVGTNRIILKHGLELIKKGSRLGIKALKKSASVKDEQIKSLTLSYILIPRINAAGRIDDANDVVRLLVTDDESEAYRIATWLNSLNAKRQEMEEKILDDALTQAESYKSEKILVLASEHWHPGVIGIVASKVSERFNRPTIILSIDGDLAKGSGRSIASFNLHEGLSRCRHLLTRFGGHKLAAGLALRASNINQFRQLLMSIADEQITEDDLTELLTIDASVGIADITMGFIKELELLEPFGYGNEEPLLGAKALEVVSAKVVGNNHLRMQLRQNKKLIDTIGFNFGDFLQSFDATKPIDTAFYPQVQGYNGSRQLRLNIKAIRQNGSSFTL